MKQTYLLNHLKLPYTAEEGEALRLAKRKLRAMGVDVPLSELHISKRSVDARDRAEICFVYAVAVGVEDPHLCSRLEKNGLRPFAQGDPVIQKGTLPMRGRPVVVGSGPAGLFCALLLAENGYAPVVLERGGCVAERVQKIEAFFETGVLDTGTNVQFGAGGAGTFSDGKLVTRVHGPMSAYVLRRFIEFGAPSEISFLAKPHIGTDRLRGIVDRMLQRIEALGGEVHYHTCFLSARERSDGTLSVHTDRGELSGGALVLAIGHSARDTYESLMHAEYTLLPKAFSVGVRIEHLQSEIDEALFGAHAGDPRLGAGEYQLSADTDTRGVYTFCMCPGGEVVASSGEAGGVVTNGMSNYRRDGRNANSAVLVSVFREDYGNTPQGAIEFQRRIEQAAFRVGGEDYFAPLCTVGDFLSSASAKTLPSAVQPTYRNGKCRLGTPDLYLPPFVCTSLRSGLTAFARKNRAFAAPHALLTGAETRTSSPIRILRGEDGTAEGHSLIYPCGEGAGYAGGITSSALDGICTALSIMKKFQPTEE